MEKRDEAGEAWARHGIFLWLIAAGIYLFFAHSPLLWTALLMFMQGIFVASIVAAFPYYLARGMMSAAWEHFDTPENHAARMRQARMVAEVLLLAAESIAAVVAARLLIGLVG